LESKYIQNNPEPVKYSFLDLMKMKAEDVDLTRYRWFRDDQREYGTLSGRDKPRLLWYLGEDVLSNANKRRFKRLPKNLIDRSSKIFREENSNEIIVFSHEIGKTLNKRLSRLRLR